ncbi:spore coat U domain-containing protein [Phyllobacterium sp. P30BS-XVII]|uniref:Csu type fimbrial protein n=1 Tax=Phyllobacterium sp. P30BS-XVII TaxID=2587046 RepID=UPI000DD7292D|nr:spore coat U domain-containing protein [Phyllobacterium sp. P30BS-XVII]MBA8902347.1 spore coat protein U-like protein [Phyllobacterium sp. P30BS-XVII]
MSFGYSTRRFAAVGLAAALGFSSPALAATATGSFGVHITIQSSCILVSATDMTFPNTGVIAADVPSTSTLSVQCTNATPYNVGLNAGTGAGATVAVRKMTGPASATINYSLYTEVTHATVWGNTVGTDTVGGTGNGAAQPFTVYGLVPAQTTPAIGTYNDTITVTVTY